MCAMKSKNKNIMGYMQIYQKLVITIQRTKIKIITMQTIWCRGAGALISSRCKGTTHMTVETLDACRDKS